MDVTFQKKKKEWVSSFRLERNTDSDWGNPNIWWYGIIKKKWFTVPLSFLHKETRIIHHLPVHCEPGKKKCLVYVCRPWVVDGSGVIYRECSPEDVRSSDRFISNLIRFNPWAALTRIIILKTSFSYVPSMQLKH